MEKLVRDNLPRIPSPGIIQIFRIASDVHEKIQFLIIKSAEERSEFYDASSHESRIEESGDVLDVYDAIILYANQEGFARLAMTYGDEKQKFIKDIQLYGLSYEAIVEARNKKTSIKGTFHTGVILVSTESVK